MIVPTLDSLVCRGGGGGVIEGRQVKMHIFVLRVKPCHGCPWLPGHSQPWSRMVCFTGAIIESY